MTDTLQNHVAAVGDALHQLDGMAGEDICGLAEQLADLADLVTGVADGRDAAIDAMLRRAGRQDRLVARFERALSVWVSP